MDDFEQLFLLFFDSLMATLVIPPRRPYVMDTMLLFGGHDRYLIAAIVVLGSVVGAFLTAVLGKIVSSGRKLKGMPEEGDVARLGDRFFASPYSMIFVLLLVWVPLYGAIVPSIASFFKGKLLHITLTSLVSFTVYNVYLLLI